MATEAPPPTTPPPWNAWALGQGQAFLATILGAVTSLGFVAFTGGLLLWARARALDLPADQVVAVAPRRELIAEGASALTLFAFVGAVAVGIVYLFDRTGRPTLQTRIGFLGLLAVELSVALVHAGPSALEAIFGGLVLAAAVACLARLSLDERYHEKPEVQPKPPDPPPTSPCDPPPALLATVARALCEWVRDLELKRLARRRAEDEARKRGAAVSETGGQQPDPNKAEKKRWNLPGPDVPLRLTTRASIKTLLVMVVATVLVWWLFRAWWVAASVAIAFGLFLVMVAISRSSGSRFGGTAAVVLGSVVVFGAAVSALRFWNGQAIQPVAALRVNEAEPVCGIYLTESDDRLYMARIDRQPSGDTSHIFWVSRKATTGWAIGSAQREERAGDTLTVLVRRLIDERRTGVASTTTVKTTTTAPPPAASAKSTEGTQTIEETKTDVPPAQPSSEDAANCSIYSTKKP